MQRHNMPIKYLHNMQRQNNCSILHHLFLTARQNPVLLLFHLLYVKTDDTSCPMEMKPKLEVLLCCDGDICTMIVEWSHDIEIPT